MNRVAELLKKAKVDAVLISHQEPSKDNNFFVFSGITEGSFIYSLLLLYKNKPILLVPDIELLEAKRSGLQYKVIKSYKDIKKLFPKIKTIGVNAQYISLAQSKALPFKQKSVSQFISDVKDVKTDAEYKQFKVACSITDKVAKEIPRWVKLGITEKQLADRIDNRFKELGGSVAFDTIVAFDKNSAVPHHTPTNVKLAKNQIILIDFGAKYKQICSDMTRCYFFGKPSKEILEVYNKVKRVQQECINKLKVGVIGKDINNYAIKEIEKDKKGIMNHTLGHGIGYDVHESRHMSSMGGKVPEMLFTTIEPGCYLEGKFGVRIEDCVVVRKNKIEIMFTATKELVVIK